MLGKGTEGLILIPSVPFIPLFRPFVLIISRRAK
jgi:hypothetical protein